MSAPRIFDRRLYARRRARAARSLASADFLHRRAMADVVDRLETATRSFPRALFFGASEFIDLLTPACGVGEAIAADMAVPRLAGREGLRLAFDEERSPVAPASLDLVVSLLSLHAANDPVGAFAQARASLKPDGLFIAVMFGERTLEGMRRAFYEAETRLAGGAGPRVAPFASVRDIGGALQRAGFALPVADVDRVDVAYRSPGRLIAALRKMGETNALIDGRRPLRRDAAAAALAALQEMGRERFDLITATGWAPATSQPRPLAPGSASASLARAVRDATPEGDV
ncbi:MAG: methyltransferase domain-containing protein [Parvularculaceae bacterium]